VTAYSRAFTETTLIGRKGVYQMKRVLVNGAGGFIGSHLVRRLRKEGFWVRGVDLKLPEFSQSSADEFVVGDLSDPKVAEAAVEGIDDVYQLAADMGGA
jgi:nucleoside-diphosphate-sugar epimerase